MYLQESASPGVGQFIVASCSQNSSEFSDAVKEN